MHVCVARRRYGPACKFLFFIFIQTALVGGVWKLYRVDILARSFGVPERMCNGSLFPNRSESSIQDDDEIVTVCKNVKRKDVDCNALFRGDKEAMKAAKNKTYLTSPPECSVQNLVKNCSTFIRAHEYIMEPVTIEERDYPLAFAIKMHKGVSQTEQLLRTIYRPQNVYCIYVDRKSIMLTFKVIVNLSKCFNNVFVIQNRDRVVYASISLVKAELECMKILVASGIRWRYYINLTGEEFPLRTNLEIVKILKSLNGANDVETYDFPTSLKKRYIIHHEIKGSNIRATNKTHPPFKYHLNLSKGSAYVILRYEFVHFMLNDEIAQEFISWLNNTYSPEETVFATLNTLLWAPGGYRLETRHVLNTYLSRAVIWTWDKVKCGGKIVRSICVFGVDDLLWLMDQPQIIANKFNIEHDPIPIDCLEELIKERTKTPDIDHLNWYYYRNLPHAKHYSEMNRTTDSTEYRLKVKNEWLRKREVNIGMR